MREGEQFQIHARSAKDLPAFLEARGLDYAALARSAGLAHAEPEQIDGYISLSRFSTLLHLASRALDDDVIGLRYALAMRVGVVGPYTYAFMSAPTLRDAMESMIKYAPLFVDAPYVELCVDGNKAHYSWSFSPLILSRNHLVDFTAALMIDRLRRSVAPRWRPLAVELEREAPRSSEMHKSCLAPEMVFSAPVNRVTFASADLRIVNAKADPALFEMTTALCDRLMAERNVPHDMLVRVKEDILWSLPKGGPSLPATARRLGMSVRAMQRRLSERGLTYNDLVEECRRDAAYQMLCETSLPIGDIAYRTGFSSQGNFTRAVKRWFDSTPRGVRMGEKG